MGMESFEGSRWDWENFGSHVFSRVSRGRRTQLKDEFRREMNIIL